MKYIPLEVIDGQIVQLDKDILRLKFERSTLIGLRELAITVSDYKSIRKDTLTDKLISFVTQSPGLSSREIATNIINNHPSNNVGGADKIKTVQTILGECVRKKRLYKQNSLFYPTPF